MKTYFIPIFLVFVICWGCFGLFNTCQKNTQKTVFINKYKTKIDTIKIYKDKIKVLKTVLKSERKVIIHDTLKCDSLYKLVLIQDTLIQKDSVLITEILHDTLFIYKKEKPYKSFLYGFGAGFAVGKLL